MINLLTRQLVPLSTTNLSLEHACHVSFVVFFLQGFAFVVLFFAFGQGDDEFGEAFVVDEEADGDDGEAGVARGTEELVQLFLGEEELAVAAGGVIVVGAVEVFSDVHVLDPQLAVGKVAEGVDQAGFALADGFYLGAGQDDAGGVGVQQFVVEGGAAVLYVNGGLFHLIKQYG